MYAMRRVRRRLPLPGMVTGLALGAALVLPLQVHGAEGDGSSDEKLQEVIVTGSLIADPNRTPPMRHR